MRAPFVFLAGVDDLQRDLNTCNNTSRWISKTRHVHFFCKTVPGIHNLNWPSFLMAFMRETFLH